VWLSSLNASSTSLRRDECGNWRVAGTRGHVYAVVLGRKPGLQIYCRPSAEGSKQAWTYAKRALAFARVTVDGDDEGLLFLDRRPTAREADVIRSYCGVRRRVVFSDERRAALSAQLARIRGTVCPKNPREGAETAEHAPELAEAGI
jgi:hypothetical protein